MNPTSEIPLVLVNPVNATLGAQATATLIVVDDDAPPSVLFSPSAYTATETAGIVNVTVILDAVSGYTVTVGYTAGSASGQVTFAPGVTSGLFTVAVIDDTKDEPNEVIPLALLNPVNVTLGAPATATLTVLDNDLPPSVRFDASAYTVTESVESATVTATLSAASDFTVNVTYTVGVTSGQVAFAPGITVTTFTVAVASDTIDEPDGMILLALASPVNATLGNPSHSQADCDGR